jgi:parallel beta-helix repeat protein
MGPVCRQNVCAMLLVATGVSMAPGGPIDPPSGPVAPTHKTLTEVEPRKVLNQTNAPGDSDSIFRITQPGSYYLEANLTGVAGKHGIEIAASGVTIDLNGFDLSGVPSMGNFDGIRTSAIGFESLTIRNGAIREWGGDGIDLVSSLSFNVRIDGVVASHNTGSGIQTGSGGTVTHSSAYFNSGNGITAGGSVVIADCSASRNGAIGISGGSGTTVARCSSYFNNTSGISVAIGSIVTECTAQSNGTDGILCGQRCTIRGNVCSQNGNLAVGAGIRTVAVGSRIEGNHCSSADVGIDIDGTANVIIRNTCTNNTINWTIVAGNVVAPIVQAATNAAAISGNTSAGSMGSTDPNANFTH